MLSILTQFLSNQSQHVMVDGCRSKLVNVVTGVPQAGIRWCGTGWFQEQGQCFFYWPLSCSIPTILFYHFPLYLLSVYRLVLWGWGLRTDRVYRVHHTLSALHCRPLNNNNDDDDDDDNNNNNNLHTMKLDERTLSNILH